MPGKSVRTSLFISLTLLKPSLTTLPRNADSNPLASLDRSKCDVHRCSAPCASIARGSCTLPPLGRRNVCAGTVSGERFLDSCQPCDHSSQPNIRANTDKPAYSMSEPHLIPSIQPHRKTLFLRYQ